MTRATTKPAPAMKDKKFSVYYRTGGTANFKWQFVHGEFSQLEAMEKCRNLSQQGYKALYGGSDLILTIGLPDTF